MTEQRLFISHANEDSAIADRIVAYLEGRGMPCWISSRDIPPRAIYADAITEAMQACSACAVIVSAASNASKAVKRELELASHYDKPFIPIRIDATEPAAGVDYYLRNTQWLDFKRDGERALDRIVGQMSSAAAAPPPSSSDRRTLVRLPLLLGGLAVVAIVGIFVWRGLGQRPQAVANAPTSSLDIASSVLVGSYNWEGLACGAGPIVTLEDGGLVFTMTGAPTYIHHVVAAESGPETERQIGYSAAVRTSVVEPSGHSGEVYRFAVYSNGQVLVMSPTDSNTWQRCPD